MIAHIPDGVIHIDQDDPLEANIRVVRSGMIVVDVTAGRLPHDLAIPLTDLLSPLPAPDESQFQEDPAWVKGMDFANQIQALELADNDPTNFGQVATALERLGEHLNAMPPLVAMLRERRILDILRTKRIKRGVGLLAAARKQAKMKIKARVESLEAAHSPA